MSVLEEKSQMTAVSTSVKKSPCLNSCATSKVTYSWLEEPEFKVPLSKKIRKTICKISKKSDNEVNRKMKPLIKKSKNTSEDEDDP